MYRVPPSSPSLPAVNNIKHFNPYNRNGELIFQNTVLSLMRQNSQKSIPIQIPNNKKRKREEYEEDEEELMFAFSPPPSDDDISPPKFHLSRY